MWIDDAAGSPVDVSGSANRVRMEFTQEVERYRVFGEGWVRRLAAGKDGALTLDVVYSTAADEGLALLRGWFFGAASRTPRTVRVQVPNGSAGSDRYAGEFLLARLALPLDAAQAEPVTVTAELLPHGPVSHSTVE
ncbi:MAG: hypothetical protein IPK19_19315 [Chloroflexi bacterium]|nr:hypothetical protein [Chloroflexota bacterium]